jgi:hypothetical protein
MAILRYDSGRRCDQMCMSKGVLQMGLMLVLAIQTRSTPGDTVHHFAAPLSEVL